MILPALIQHYDRLEEAGEDIAPFGFSRQKISFCVHLDENGTLLDIQDLRVESGRNNRLDARKIVVPGQSKPPGQGINPCFLWDNSSYMLGWKADDDKPDRTRKSFEGFREKHLDLLDTIEDDRYRSVCAFLKEWNPDQFNPDEPQQECLTAFGVFRVGEEKAFAHDRSSVIQWFTDTQVTHDPDDADDPKTPSLTTGRSGCIARLHEPKIKGVREAQSSGTTLVSFNEDAFESYGKSQGANAPVGVHDAFKYCTALNRLLADEDRKTTIGDATVVWWTDAPDGVGPDLISACFKGNPTEETPSSEDAATLSRLGKAVRDITAGRKPADLADAEAHFYVLGLSPNAARLSVRFWWDGSLGEMVDRLAQHHADARLEPIPEREIGRPLTIYQTVRATAQVLKGKARMDTVSPTLAGAIARAVLNGGPYPQSLLEAIIRRVRTDGEINHLRASIVKACITRRRRVLAGPDGQHEEVPVSLNTEGPEAYQLGRLFATLEKTQEDALGSVNASIRDRYFGSASATPAAIFPRLVRLNQHHIAKLEGGQRVNREKLIQEVCSHIDRFPRHLNMEEQGLFQIGFYHQYQAFFTKTDADAPQTQEH